MAAPRKPVGVVAEKMFVASLRCSLAVLIEQRVETEDVAPIAAREPTGEPLDRLYLQPSEKHLSRVLNVPMSRLLAEHVCDEPLGP
jgi:hypothetical protein